jgi:hypothetical protein
MLKGHGGVVIGSEMSGNVRRITITNCVFEGTDRGIRIKTMRGRGGVIEDLLVSNIVMNNMINEGILITLRYQRTDPEPLSERTPACNNVRISNIIVKGGQRPVAIYGLEERDVSQISFSNMETNTRMGILIENGSEISFHDIKMQISEGSALEAKDSKRLTWDKVTVSTPLVDTPLMKLTNCNGILFTNCFQPEVFSLLISEDEKSGDIIVANNILPSTSALVNKNGKNILTNNNITKNTPGK